MLALLLTMLKTERNPMQTIREAAASYPMRDARAKCVNFTQSPARSAGLPRISRLQALGTKNANRLPFETQKDVRKKRAGGL